MNRVQVAPQLITWARERAGFSVSELTHRFPKLAEWEVGTVQPTLRQLEDFASAVHVAVGYLFLAQPPAEVLPIADFRTVGGRGANRPSPDLIDTIYLCQQRQEWFREYATQNALPRCDFVGSASLSDDPIAIGRIMRDTLFATVHDSRVTQIRRDGLQQYIHQAERVGILVMVNGVVGNNTTRKLSIEEFRGFALADSVAPLIFINGADAKSAQLFTFAHEIAHLWLGQSGVSNPVLDLSSITAVERWCNAVAAEFLVPFDELTRMQFDNRRVSEEIQRIARHFKVSSFVALRRVYDARWISKAVFQEQYALAIASLVDKPATTSGGDFYNTLALRAGKRFLTALVTSTLEGNTLFRDAYRLLGVQNANTFNEIARKFEVTA